ncbi:hypothetical protein MTO96_015781 [Rhipicephalus appendiculatus]
MNDALLFYESLASSSSPPNSSYNVCFSVAITSTTLVNSAASPYSSKASMTRNVSCGMHSLRSCRHLPASRVVDGARCLALFHHPASAYKQEYVKDVPLDLLGKGRHQALPVFQFHGVASHLALVGHFLRKARSRGELFGSSASKHRNSHGVLVFRRQLPVVR